MKVLDEERLWTSTNYYNRYVQLQILKHVPGGWNVAEMSPLTARVEQTTHSHILGGLMPYRVYEIKVKVVTTADTGQQVLGRFSNLITVRMSPAGQLNPSLITGDQYMLTHLYQACSEYSRLVVSILG